MNGFTRAGLGAGAVLLCTILGPASLALAGYQDGPYAGHTDQTVELAFRADDDRVRGLDTVVYAECEEGPRQKITIERGKTEIADDRFSLELAAKGDLRVNVTGKLRAERAWGRIEAVVKPHGTVCRAEVRWQASLRKG
jgi:hypothetical protein